MHVIIIDSHTDSLNTTLGIVIIMIYFIQCLSHSLPYYFGQNLVSYWIFDAPDQMVFLT